MRPVVLSFGGGVQSSALVALLGRGEYPGTPPHEVWFCDPKNERPQTYEWIERVIKPYCERIGVPFLTLSRDWGSVRGPDIMAYYRGTKRYPLRSNRQCTTDWKANVMRHYYKERGWLAGGVEQHLGISLDELPRARTCPYPDTVNRYPLIEARLFRDDCLRLCQETFGEQPVKSGCWWCKYQRPAQWREVWDARADGRWDAAVEWEREVLATRTRARVFIDARPHRTLPQWAAAWEQGEQLPLDFTDAACDGGYCMI